MRSDAYGAARARLEEHRRTFDNNAPLRALYARWYRRIRRALPSRNLGEWVELGSGPGLGARFIPELVLTDVVLAPWLHLRVDGTSLPFGSGRVGALVLFDVLHHLGNPGRFLAEASRVLCAGGRIVLCEPYVSPLSWFAYRYFHEESVDFRVDPFEQPLPGANDPFAGNQAVPRLLLKDRVGELQRRFPLLRVTLCETFAGPSYALTGGFGRPPSLPEPFWRLLLGLEDALPRFVFDLVGFRMFVVLEKLP